METYCMVLGTVGLIFAVIDARTVDQLKRCLNGVADSLSLILLSFIHLRVSLRRPCVHLLRCLQKYFYARKRSMCGQMDWNTDLKSEGAVNKSEFLQFVRLSMETVNEVVDGVCRLLRGVLSLCGAALHFFQGALYLATALVHLKFTIFVYAQSCFVFLTE